MSLIYRIVFIMIMGIGISLFVYPLLHELGHLIAGLIVHYDVVSYSVFPSPSITFLTDSNRNKIYFVSISAVALPILVTLLFPKKSVVVRLCSCAVVFLDTVNTVILAVCGVMYMCGFSVADNDATAVLRLCNGDSFLYFLSIVLIIILGLSILIHLRPYHSIERFLTKRKAQSFPCAKQSKLCRTYGSKQNPHKA